MRMMSVKEYAVKMASSVSLIRRMCAEGILPSVKIGKSYKIDVERADEYFREQIDARMAKPNKAVVRIQKLTTGKDFLSKLDELQKGVRVSEQKQMC